MASSRSPMSVMLGQLPRSTEVSVGQFRPTWASP